MVEHTCTRCGKSFPKLWKLRRHNERQYKCKPIQVSIPQVKDQDESQMIAPIPQVKGQGVLQ